MLENAPVLLLWTAIAFLAAPLFGRAVSDDDRPA